MDIFEVEFFEKDDGSFPVEEFILSQDIKMRAKIFRNLELLASHGDMLREPYSKSLGNGIFEIRTRVKSDITRILYFFVLGKKIILTNGFVKKTQKTPQKEINLALSRRNEYFNREVN